MIFFVFSVLKLHPLTILKFNIIVVYYYCGFQLWKQNFYNTVLEATGSQERTPALAIRIYGDKSAFHECGFIGFQDTVWDVKGRHYFNSCYIEGAVDFIWGGGQSFYEVIL